MGAGQTQLPPREREKKFRRPIRKRSPRVTWPLAHKNKTLQLPSKKRSFSKKSRTKIVYTFFFFWGKKFQNPYVERRSPREPFPPTASASQGGCRSPNPRLGLQANLRLAAASASQTYKYLPNPHRRPGCLLEPQTHIHTSPASRIPSFPSRRCVPPPLDRLVPRAREQRLDDGPKAEMGIFRTDLGAVRIGLGWGSAAQLLMSKPAEGRVCSPAR